MSLTDKFDRNRKKSSGNIAQDKAGDDGEAESFAKAGAMRNICFVMLDGKREFFSYADLSRCSYDPEESKITLNFRGFASVTLKGIDLEKLYEGLQGQIPRQIVCKAERHKSLKKESEGYVTEIIITDVQIL